MDQYETINALRLRIRRDRDVRGLSDDQIAEKHQLSRPSLKLLDEDRRAEMMKVVVEQGGTQNRASIVVIVPEGTTYYDVKQKLLNGESL